MRDSSICLNYWPPISPYAVYNVSGGQPENLLDFMNILQEEFVRADVLPSDFDFEAHKKLVPMQPGDAPTTYADATAFERDFEDRGTGLCLALGSVREK